MSLDYRDEIYWYYTAKEREFTDEKNNLISRRLATSLDSEPARRRLLQIDFELQKIRQDKKELPNGR